MADVTVALSMILFELQHFSNDLAGHAKNFCGPCVVQADGK